MSTKAGEKEVNFMYYDRFHPGGGSRREGEKKREKRTKRTANISFLGGEKNIDDETRRF